MKVLKFGGTSVGTIESLRNVREIVDSLTEPAIIVVSALGGLTDTLIHTAQASARGEKIYEESMIAISKRHNDIIDALIPEKRKEGVRRIITDMLQELGDVYKGLSLIKSLPERTLDLVVSFGERMSSVIVASIIKDADHHDSLDYMRTERWFNKDIADRPLTEELIKKEITLPLRRHVVMGGFISRDRDTLEITNLGRGGSDYSAALIAAALNADEYQIWTDVDGFLTADPRVVKNVRLIPRMTFVESMELCSFGAKVIYPPTIYPVFHKNIPIKILNTFNPKGSGTLISDEQPDGSDIRGVSVLGNTGVITVIGSLTSNVAEINTRAYNALSRNGITVLLVGRQEDGAESLALVLADADIENGKRRLEGEFTTELRDGYVTAIEGEKGYSIIAIVGEGIKKSKGLGRRLVNTLERNGISVITVSGGTSDTKIALVVESKNAKEALSLIHEAAIG